MQPLSVAHNYCSRPESSMTRNFRVIADMSGEIGLERDLAASVVDSLESVDRLQRLRKDLLESCGEAEAIGLPVIRWSAIQIIESPGQLETLLSDLEILMQLKREELLIEEENIRRDMRVVMQAWLLVMAELRNKRMLCDLKAHLSAALQLTSGLAVGRHEFTKLSRSRSGGG